MKHFFTTTVKIVLVAAVLIAVALAMVSNLTGKAPADTLMQTLLTPIRNGASALTAQAERFYNYMFHYEALEAENAKLRQELAQLRQDALRADATQRENDRLRDLLEMDPAKEGFTLVDAYIISRDPTEWNSVFTVNRGANAGIEVGMCVITEGKAVVGLVTEVGPNYAVVKTVLDSSLQIAASVADSGYNGMITGGYATDQEGLLRMKYLPTSAVLRNQDQVVTAGSTVYPRSLILGHIIDVGIDETGVGKYAIVEPAADIRNLEQVFILTEFTME